MSGKRVPLVIYRNGKREEIGSAYVEDSGIITGLINDAEVVKELGLPAGKFTGLSDVIIEKGD